MKQLIKNAWLDYCRFIKKYCGCILIASFIFTLCWMVMDAVNHPHPVNVTQR